MSVVDTLHQRANQQCELCSHREDLAPFIVPPHSQLTVDSGVLLCGSCHTQMKQPVLQENYWRCLTDSIWNINPAVQVLAYSLLARLTEHGWALDCQDSMYMEDETQRWAKALVAADSIEPTLDCNGIALTSGDNVTVIKDLVVKGAGFTAKRGTPVRSIGLSENPLHIEGRVNGVRVVLIAAYCKKS